MLEIFGKKHFINIDEVIKICRPNYKVKNTSKKLQDKEDDEYVLELNVFKYELLKSCIERILTEYEDVDEKLGSFGAEESTNISFKFAYNTLLKYNILIEDEYE